ncbi:MAG: ABC transporter ATP-binding protein [Nitrospira sp.]|nr:ABC transporter ATP-binding protein [Nitrospira sp.]
MGNVAIRVEQLSKKYEIMIGKSRGESGLAERFTQGVQRMLRMKGAPASTSPRREEVWPIRDVSFEVETGDVVGIIGRNGAGKSTLLKLLSRITEPTSGRAQMFGRVGTLLEVGTGFHPELTGRDNIYLSGIILGMKKAEIDKKFDEIVEFSGIDKYIDTPVKRYSSGMYVRLAFAVGAHLDPEILIVDEVLAVGDSQFQQKCMNKMHDIGEKGRTVIFVSHNMSAVARLCNKAIFLQGGRLVKQGPTHEIVGEYLYNSGALTGCREWLDPTKAPQDDIARLCAVRVRTEKGIVTDTVDIGEAVGVELEYEVLQPGHILVPNFGFKSDEGETLFVSNDRDPTWLRRPRPVGRYSSTVWVPGHFFGEGTVIVGGGLVREAPFHEHCDYPEAVAFHVTESNEGITARGDYTGDIPGKIRPLLKWTTNCNSAGDSQ